jgi:rsbT antagonist protein RsbS
VAVSEGARGVQRIPILRMGDLLLVTIQFDMDDVTAASLEADLSQAITRDHAAGVLIDVSGLDLVDSFIGRTLGSIAATSRLLGAETVVVGIRPAVAITLIELGVELSGIRTALNVERGMRLLRPSHDLHEH